jgi:hypothetical protein
MTNEERVEIEQICLLELGGIIEYSDNPKKEFKRLKDGKWKIKGDDCTFIIEVKFGKK